MPIHHSSTILKKSSCIKSSRFFIFHKSIALPISKKYFILVPSINSFSNIILCFHWMSSEQFRYRFPNFFLFLFSGKFNIFLVFVELFWSFLIVCLTCLFGGKWKNNDGKRAPWSHRLTHPQTPQKSFSSPWTVNKPIMSIIYHSLYLQIITHQYYFSHCWPEEKRK